MSQSFILSVEAVFLFLFMAHASAGDGLESSSTQPWPSTHLHETRKPHNQLKEKCYNRLHKEIEDFYTYMAPTEEERQIRRNVMQRVNDTILNLWPEATVRVFGSFDTGLDLPTSDFDLEVFGNWSELPLYTLEQALVDSNISKHENNQVLSRAHVPIIKLFDDACRVKIDISFNMENGLRSSELIKEYRKRYPDLPKLVLVLKQFLLHHDLNEVHTGGLSSYGLVLLTINFLQLHPRPTTDQYLGVLLLKFLDLYGRKVDYKTTAIRIKDGGAFLPKAEVEKHFTDHNCSMLCLEDPLATEDLGRNTHRASEIHHAFKKAYYKLHKAVTSPNCIARKVSILGQIVQVPDQVISYRNWVREGSCRNTSNSGRKSTITSMKFTIVFVLLLSVQSNWLSLLVS